MLKSDIKVLIVVAAILCCVVAMFLLLDRNKVDDTVVLDADTTLTAPQHANEPRYYSDYKPRERHLQTFDPNTADSTVLLGLGLSEWMVRNIYKYRAAGGVYSTPDDFGRTYGLTMKQYRELKPYIRISADYRPASELIAPRHTEHQTAERDTFQRQPKLRLGQHINLNTADTTELKMVPGIGSFYATRIVELRNRLGGFVSTEQLMDINNMPASALDYFDLPPGGIRKININRADFKQLVRHPYIGYERAKAISAYRQSKGHISSLQQLSLLDGFGASERQRLEPYIEY